MPNDDYIKRSDALAYVRHAYPKGFNLLMAYINVIPAADVEPVRHGYYIGTKFDGYADGNPVYYEWKCSECDCVFEDDEPKYRYCPHCGAKMDAKPPEEKDD